MQLPAHLAVTAALLGGASLIGLETSPEISLAVLIGGVLIDLDKGLEVLSNSLRKDRISDITARSRILHSFLVFPFGLALSWLVLSWLPFLAVLLHVVLDSFIPAIEKGGKNYPSHPPWKWLSNPFSDKSWSKVTNGWPVAYPPKFNRIYNSVSFLNIPASIILFVWLIFLVAALFR